MKKKRALYNLIVGMGSKFVLMVLGFIIPKIFIENYGSDVNGLLSSIGQVFAYLNLVEAGIGVATTQALYKAVAKDDWNEISAIMNASSGFYRRTGYYLFHRCGDYQFILCSFCEDTAFSEPGISSYFVFWNGKCVKLLLPV